MIDQAESTAVIVAAALVDSLRRSVAERVTKAYRAGASPARMLAVVRESLADDRISLAYPELPAELMESRRAMSNELVELMEATELPAVIDLPFPSGKGWITMSGAHVEVADSGPDAGTITKGPLHMRGVKPEDVGKKADWAKDTKTEPKSKEATKKDSGPSGPGISGFSPPSGESKSKNEEDKKDENAAGQAAGSGDGDVLPVPDRRQDSSYSCGPAALEAIASYFGIEVDEATLRRLAETDPAEGTEADDLARAARELGLTAKLISGMDLDDIAAAIAADRPVIVGMQAYGTPAQENAGDAGHYEVVCGYNAETQIVTLQDPARDPEAGRTEMPADEFMEKWKLAGRGGVMVEKLGIIIGRGAAAGADDAVGRKIAKLRNEGKSAEQAAAIAYSMDRKGDL